ncbi:hypothetical protein JY97_09635 [Alkalispirochaeta odontotermitis]|nr:hypothetical protein JY97_09635 [Alkalispirochaeta odontotermitis]CAB1076546.1 hypothetical protein D1AOALGA4SA_4342 [Olavius algarvensis Delta 1 endosymbiont]
MLRTTFSLPERINPNIEIRNPKQNQNSNVPNSKFFAVNLQFYVLKIDFLEIGKLFRISCFGFRVSRNN